MSLILLKCGGIELNPRPFSESSSISNKETELSGQTLKDTFTVVHYDIQSLLNKTNIIPSEFLSFDVICLTETWLNDGVSDADVQLPGYNM